MNISSFLPKAAISEDVFGTVYDLIISGERSTLVRISDGIACEKLGDEYCPIIDPVDWLLSRSASIPGIARKAVAKMVPQFKPLVSEYLLRFCAGGGKALIEFHGPETGGVTLTFKIKEEKQTIENEQIRSSFSKYMFENQQKV